jgi:transposase
LGKILPKYVVYVSVMRAIAESMKKIEEQKLEARLVKGGPLEKEWKTLKERITERQASFGSLLQNPERCHNSKVWPLDFI